MKAAEDGSGWTRTRALRQLAQERRPALSRRFGAEAAYVALDGALGDLDTELEQLAADALGAPRAVLRRHARDERDDLRRQTRFSRRLGLRANSPEAAKRDRDANAAASAAGPGPRRYASWRTR